MSDGTPTGDEVLDHHLAVILPILDDLAIAIDRVHQDATMVEVVAGAKPAAADAGIAMVVRVLATKIDGWADTIEAGGRIVVLPGEAL